MINILHHLDPQKDNSGGIETFLSEMIKFCPHDLSMYFITPENVLSNNNAMGRAWIRFLNLKVRRIPKILQFGILVLFNLRSIRRKSGNTFLVQRMEFVLIAKLIKPFSRVRLIVHTDSVSYVSTNSESVWRFFPKLFFLLEKMLLKSVLSIHVVHKPEYLRLNRIHRNVKFLNFSYDESIFRLNSNTTRKNRVSWIGRFETQKNPELAAQILASLSPLNIETAMVGKGSLFKGLKKEYEGKINFYPELSRTEISELLQSSRILLMTSRFEGAPRVMIEALACGAHILCTDSSDPNNYRDLFTDQITILRDTNPDTFVRFIESFDFVMPRASKHLAEFSNTYVFSQLWSELTKGSADSE